MSDGDGLRPSFVDTSPLIGTTPVPNCPVCSSALREPLADGYDYELETCANRWHFWRCGSCASVWLDPRPDVASLAVIYPPHYYAYNMNGSISSFALKGKAWLDERKFAGILKKTHREPGAFLDIGCGDGRYLELLARRGLPRNRIFGLELSAQTVDALRARGFEVFRRRVEECIEIPDQSIDLATMFHVIEHVANPVEVIRRIASWLKPGGLLAIETPNTSAWDARLFRKTYWGGYHIPRHWTLFDEKSIAELCARGGLEVVDVRYQTGHSFWMYSFHHAMKYNRRWRSALIARWFDPLRGLPLLIGFTGFDIARRMFGFRTSAILAVARKPEA